MYTKTRALVLREVNYKESDKLLTVLTDALGKQTVKARGCRRRGSRLTAAAQLLVYSDMTLFLYRDRLTLQEAESLEQFRGVRENFGLLALSAYFAEVIEAVAEEDVAQPALLSLILNSLYGLGKLHKTPALVKAAFELRVMCLAGYAPALEGCVSCGDNPPIGLGLDPEKGVLCCPQCAHRLGLAPQAPLSPAALAALRYVVSTDPKRLFSFSLEGDALGEVGRVAEAFLLAQLDRRFRTLDYYHQVQGV